MVGLQLWCNMNGEIRFIRLWEILNNGKIWTRYLKKENTYIAVCNWAQQHYLQAILKYPDFKILYKSKPAINRNYPGRKKEGVTGNTVVVFELK